MKTKSMLIAIAASLTLSAAAHAEEFAALEGVPGEAMSRSEMATVQGKGGSTCMFSMASLIDCSPRYTFNGVLWSKGVQAKMGIYQTVKPSPRALPVYQSVKSGLKNLILRNAGMRG